MPSKSYRAAHAGMERRIPVHARRVQKFCSDIIVSSVGTIAIYFLIIATKYGFNIILP
jgi:hypothetical protein